MGDDSYGSGGTHLISFLHLVYGSVQEKVSGFQKTKLRILIIIWIIIEI